MIIISGIAIYVNVYSYPGNHSPSCNIHAVNMMLDIRHNRFYVHVMHHEHLCRSIACYTCSSTDLSLKTKRVFHNDVDIPVLYASLSDSNSSLLQ